LTDAEIVDRVRAGASEAYSELVTRYQSAVYGQAYHHLQNFEDARDVAQEALVQAYLRLDQLREPAKFSPWLRQVTVNECHKWQRRQRAAEPLDTDAATPHEVEQVETRLVIREALACLSETSRLTLTLFYMHSYSLHEIAAFLEFPVTTIKSRLRNARARLRKELTQMVEDTMKQEPLPEDFNHQIRESIRAANQRDFSKLQSLIAKAQDNPPLMETLRVAMENDLKEGWQRFTGKARHVCWIGQQEAVRLHSPHVEAEHLLLGLLRETDGMGARVLHQAGISLVQVQQEIEDVVRPDGVANLEPETSPQATRTLELAAEEAKRMAQDLNVSHDIGTEHLLLGLLRETDNLAARLLHRLDLDLDKARTYVRQHLISATNP